MLKIPMLSVDHSTFPQNADADAVAARLLAGDTKLHSVYQYYDRYQARVFIGHRQIVVSSGTLHGCLRMADAALLHFWPYRKRPARAPLDTDFNIGLDMAKFDLANCAEVRDYLVAVEQRLIANGELKVEHRRYHKGETFSREHLLFCTELFSGAVGQLLTSLPPEAKLHSDTIADLLRQLRSAINSTDRQFVKAMPKPARDISMDQPL